MNESKFKFRVLYDDILYSRDFPLEDDPDLQDKLVSLVDRYSRGSMNYEDFKFSLEDLGIFHEKRSEIAFIRARLWSSIMRANYFSSNVYCAAEVSSEIVQAIKEYVMGDLSFEDFKKVILDMGIVHPVYFGD